MKLKALKLRNATILNNSQMKTVWGRSGYDGNGYDDPIYDGGYLPELEVICSKAPTTEGGGGRCWTWNSQLQRCVRSPYPQNSC